MRHTALKRLAMAAMLLAPATLLAQHQYRINTVEIQGNKITRPRIINRELTMHPGDRLHLDSLRYHMERSRSNLRNVNLFNFVEIDTCINPLDSTIDVVIRMQERWYVFPIPIFKVADRNIPEWIDNGWKLDRLDYGLHLVWNNFRGRREILEIEARFGYNWKFGFEYSFPYLDRKQRFGLEVGAEYARNREVTYSSADNKRLLNNGSDDHAQQYIEAYVEPSFRPQLYNVHKLLIGYSEVWTAPEVAQLNPHYLANGKDHVRFMSIEYNLRSDLRDYNSYPLKGYLFEFIFRKDGLGIVGSDIDQFSAYVTFNKYWPLHRRWHFVHGTTLKASSVARQSYYLQEGLGYHNDFVRGYELYVVDAQHFLLFKSSLKWTAFPTRVLNLKFLKSNKFGLIPFTFYMNLNLDAAYSIDSQISPKARLSNTWLMGGGLGLDMVTYYDVVIRFEYSMNRHLEHGFRLHVGKHI